MKHHFKRPTSKLAARKKQELWEGRRGKPKPPPLEKRHRWMGGYDPALIGWLQQAQRERKSLIAAERAKRQGKFAARRRAHR